MSRTFSLAYNMLSLKTGEPRLRLWKSFAKATSGGREAKIQVRSAADRLSSSRTSAASLLWGSVGKASPMPCSRMAGLGDDRKPSLNAGGRHGGEPTPCASPASSLSPEQHPFPLTPF